MELADMQRLGRCGQKLVEVQILSAALKFDINYIIEVKLKNDKKGSN